MSPRARGFPSLFRIIWCLWNCGVWQSWPCPAPPSCHAPTCRATRRATPGCSCDALSPALEDPIPACREHTVHLLLACAALLIRPPGRGHLLARCPVHTRAHTQGTLHSSCCRPHLTPPHPHRSPVRALHTQGCPLSPDSSAPGGGSTWASAQLAPPACPFPPPHTVSSPLTPRARARHSAGHLWGGCGTGCAPRPGPVDTGTGNVPKAKQRLPAHPCSISFWWFLPSVSPCIDHLDLSTSCVMLIIPAAGHLDSLCSLFKSLTEMFNEPGPRIAPCGLPLETSLLRKDLGSLMRMLLAR